MNKTFLLSFQDFLHNNLMILFQNVLCYCKALNNNSNKLLLLGANPKTRFLDIQQISHTLPQNKGLEKKILEWFGYKTIDFIGF